MRRVDGDCWEVEHRAGAVASLFELADRMRGGPRRAMVLRPESGALVLGSTQPVPTVDSALGLPIVRRRSGGGAVLLEPGAQAWIELWLPRADPLWVDDVGESFLWLGEVWLAALRRFGIDPRVVHGPYDPGRWGHLACFAGLGPGELAVGDEKVVGISQRRSREGAGFSMAAIVDFDASRLFDVLEAAGLVDTAVPYHRSAVAEVDRDVGSTDQTADQLEAAFVASLPTLTSPAG